MLLFPGSANHLLTHSKGLLLILREYRLMPLLLMLGIKHGPVIAAVIFNLEGVGADQNLGRANEGIEAALIALQHLVIADLGIEILRSIAGHDHQHRNLLFVIASELGFVGQRLENEPLKQSPETGGHIAQVIGRADNQTIRIADGIQYRSQAILADADW